MGKTNRNLLRGGTLGGRKKGSSLIKEKRGRRKTKYRQSFGWGENLLSAGSLPRPKKGTLVGGCTNENAPKKKEKRGMGRPDEKKRRDKRGRGPK